MHVYADTWAHQGFAGVNHIINHATNICSADGEPDESLADKLKNYFLNTALPLGHGAVLSNPDRPHLEWAYTNGLGERIVRRNPDDYLEASEQMCRAMQRFRAGDPDARVPGLPPKDKETIAKLLCQIEDDDGEDRHGAWIFQMSQGAFSFGAESVAYLGEGDASWKEKALGPKGPTGTFGYRPEFLSSDWKRFHDALQTHRFAVLHDILPGYGICAA
jgi:hypothetical protein